MLNTQTCEENTASLVSAVKEQLPGKAVCEYGSLAAERLTVSPGPAPEMQGLEPEH